MNQACFAALRRLPSVRGVTGREGLYRLLRPDVATAVVLTKPPESVLAVFLRGADGECFLFDSHPRPNRDLPASYIAGFKGVGAFLDFLDSLFPFVPLGGLQDEVFNTIEATPLLLREPGLDRPPSATASPERGRSECALDAWGARPDGQLTSPSRAQPAQRPLLEIERRPLMCPIAMALTADPVTTSDGNTYERASIEEHWRVQTTEAAPEDGS